MQLCAVNTKYTIKIKNMHMGISVTEDAMQVNIPLEKFLVFPCIKALCSDISELRYHVYYHV